MPQIAVHIENKILKIFILQSVQSVGLQLDTTDDTATIYLCDQAGLQNLNDQQKAQATLILIDHRDNLNNPDYTEGFYEIPLPFRAGLLLDRLSALIYGQVQHFQDQIIIQDCVFFPTEMRWTNSQKDTIKLTEKERDILYVLCQLNGENIDRKGLQDRIWKYADGVESHTLETHLYRLRQKIEPDPSIPKFIITEEEGYKVIF